MEPAPIYQGQAFATPRVANASSSMPTKPLFADLWEQNRHEATKALQGIEQALIDRNDNTILLSQQAEAKANDIALTTELKNRLSLPNGAPNGFYDANGKIIPSAVREIVTRYRNLTHSWNKALIDPTNQQRSAESTTAYQQGITSATEAAILANMHEREATAYKENIRYSAQLGQYDDARRLTEEANANGAFSDPQAGMIIHDIEKQEAEVRYSNMTAIELARTWNTPEERSALRQFPELERQVRRRLESESLRGVPAGIVMTRNSDGSTSVKQTPATPPANAPYYLQQHWMQWGGEFKTPEAKIASASVIQRWLSQYITRLKGSEEGDSQWARGRFLANQLGISDAEYEQFYETRTKQISYGGFNPNPVLESISRDAFLSITYRDEVELAGHNEADAEKIRNRIANAVRDKILHRYEVWYSQNSRYNPQGRDQAAKLQEIIEEVKQEARANITDEQFNSLPQSSRDNFGALMNQYADIRTKYVNEQETRIAREVELTNARRVRAESEGSWLRLANRGRVSLGTAARNGLTRNNMVSRAANMASLNTFAFELGRGEDAVNLDDSDTKPIIYIPEGQKLPAESMGVLFNNGRNRINIEFRHANVSKPTMSLMLKMATGTTTRNPASVRWDGVNLIFSPEDIEEPYEYELAVPYSTEGSLLPDDGINPEDAQMVEDWQMQIMGQEFPLN